MPINFLPVLTVFWEALFLPLKDDYSGPDATLPPSLTTLEWTNRRESRFVEFAPKLMTLHRLEYVLLGHVDLAEPAAMKMFRLALNRRNTPRLQFLVCSVNIPWLCDRFNSLLLSWFRDSKGSSICLNRCHNWNDIRKLLNRFSTEILWTFFPTPEELRFRASPTSRQFINTASWHRWHQEFFHVKLFRYFAFVNLLIRVTFSSATSTK